MPRILLLTVAFFLLPGDLWGQDVAQRAPVPSDAEIAQASKLVAEVYKDSYSAAKTPQQKQALALKIFEDAEKTADDPVARFAMLQVARKMATGLGDVSLAMQIVDATARRFEVDAASLRREAVLSLRTLAKTPADHYLVTRHMGLLISSLLEDEQYAEALEVAVLAVAAARRAGDPDLVKQWVRRQTDLAARAKAQAGVKEALATLATMPADPAANALAGKYYCFVQEDWAKGVPMLALGDDPNFQTVAAKDLAGAPKAEDEVALADAWYELAEKEAPPAKHALLRYAAQRYWHAAPGLSAIAKRRVELRLAEVEAMTSPFPANEWVEILDLVQLPKHNARDVWTREGLLIVSRREQNNAAFTIPVAVSGSYELRIRATVREGNDFVTVGLGPDLNGALLIINGFDGVCSGLSHIEGREATDNPSRSPAVPIVKGRSHLLHVQVQLAGDAVVVAAAVEGKPVVRWRGPTQSLSISKGWPSDRLLLSSHQTITAIESVQLKLHGGSARLLD